MRKLPSVLSVRLGPDAARGLDELLDAERHDWSDQVLTLAGERFERRLIEEVSKLRQELAKDRFELVKWMFLFWVSQLAAMSAVMSFLLKR